MDYAGKGYCAHGKATPGSEWTLGTAFGSPDVNCCTCGRWKLPNRSALAADQACLRTWMALQVRRITVCIRRRTRTPFGAETRLGCARRLAGS